jgi:hypothetical protein
MVGFRRYLTTAIVLAFLVNPSLGQEPGPANLIDVEFSVYSFKRITGLRYTNPAGALEDVTFYSSSRSPVHRYKGANPVVFYSTVADPSSENPDGVSHLPVAEVSVPPGVRKALLIFFASERSEDEVDRYLVYPYDDSLSNLSQGEIVFFNVSGFTMDGFIDRRQVSLRLGPSAPYRVGGGTIRVTLGVYAGRRYRQSFDSPVSLGSDQRGIVFFFPPFLEGSPEVQSRVLIENLAARADPEMRRNETRE